MILAIDPGEHPGYAIWDAGELVFCAEDPPESFAGITRVVVEGQDFRRRVRGRRVRPESIGTLCLRAGAQAAAAAAYAGLDWFEVIPVAKWKDAVERGGGRLAKAVFVERCRRRWGLPAGSFSADAVEAAGLGFAAASVKGRVFEI